MAITLIDENTALVLIDLQNGVLVRLAPDLVAMIVERAGALAAAFRQRSLPVFLVNMVGSPPGRTRSPRLPKPLPAGWIDLVEGLGRQPGDHTLSKHSWSAFTKTGLEGSLRHVGVTHVVVGGVSTSVSVEGTARGAYERGFNVTLAVDAMADRDHDAHTNSIDCIFPRLGETGTVAEIVGLLAGVAR